jgi:hypothetical protein
MLAVAGNKLGPARHVAPQKNRHVRNRRIVSVKPIRERKFPVPPDKFPVPAKKFPVPAISGNLPTTH